MHWLNRKSRTPQRTSLDQLQADIDGLTESIDYALSLPPRLQKPDHIHAMCRTRGSLKLYRDLHYPMHELQIVCQPCPYCDYTEEEMHQWNEETDTIHAPDYPTSAKDVRIPTTTSLVDA